MSKIITTIFCLVFYCLASGQSNKKCPEYDKCLVRAANFLRNDNLEEARKEYSTAKIFAKECGVSDSLAEKGIEDVIDRYKKQKEDAVKAKEDAIKAKSLADENIRQMTDLISKITDLIQDDKNAGVLGFTPIKTDLLTALIPANKFVSANSKSEHRPWRNAEVHLQLGFTYEDIGDGIKSEKELLQSYLESKQLIEKLIKRKQNIPDELGYVYLRAVLYHSWNLITKSNIQEAKKVITSAEFILPKIKINTPKQYYAIAGFSNLQNRYYSILGNDSLALSKIQNAVEFSRKAVLLDSKNIKYKTALAQHLTNLSLEDKLPKNIISDLKNEACDIVYKVDSAEGSGSFAMNGIVQCLIDNSYDSTNQKNTILKILQTISRIDNLSHLDPKGTDYSLYKARLFLRLAEIYEYSNISIGVSSGKEVESLGRKKAIEYYFLGIDNWIKHYSTKVTIENLWQTKNSYRDITTLMDRFSINPDSSYTITKKITDAFENNIKVYGDVIEVAEINASANGRLAELTLKKNYKDTSLALTYLNKSIRGFEILSTKKIQTKYDESYANYCKAYDDRIKIYISQKKAEKAKEDYRKMFYLFYPIYKRYEFDFYLGQHFWGSAMRMGKFLFEIGQVKEAIPILEYASLNAVKESTEILESIYRNGISVTKNISLADSLKKLAAKQSMKRFTVPCDFAGKKEPFYIYVRELPKSYPYKGIDDQAEWLLQARGGIVPEDVRSSFIKLQKIAWDNDVSFPDLCVYALGEAQKDSSVKKAVPKENLTEEFRLNKSNIYALVSGKNNNALFQFFNLYLIQKDFPRADSTLRIIDSIFSTSILTDSAKIRISQNYNSLAWNCLLAKNWDNVEYYLLKSIEYDSISPYPKGNLPHVYLLSNKYQKAKRYYLKYKDLPFDIKAGYPTYKDAFLSDFDEFKKVGIVSRNIDKIIRLLNE